MRFLALLLVATVVFADGIRSEKADLQSKEPERIERGAEALALRDDAAAVDALVRVVRKCAKEHDRQGGAFDKALIKGYGRVNEALEMIRGEGSKVKSQSDYRKFQEKMEKSRELADKGLGMVREAIERFTPHSMRRACALDALDAVKSEEAVERLAEIAEREPPGPARQWLLAGLVSRATPRIGELMLTLRSDRDPRTRALAVRGLGRHIQREGVTEALVELSGDDCWQVRRGAYAGLFAAKMAEPLAAAYEGESGDERRLLAGYLFELGKGEEPVPPPEPAFGYPFSSKRVRFVIALSEGMERSRPRIEGEVRRALESLPEGARFQIVTVGPKVDSFSNAPLPVRSGTPRKVIRWLSAQSCGGKLSGVLLRRNLVPSYDHPSRGKRVFRELPDSIYLILPGEEPKEAASALLGFRRWNLACDASLYVRVLGEEPGEELASEVRKLGGKISGESFGGRGPDPRPVPVFSCPGALVRLVASAPMRLRHAGRAAPRSTIPEQEGERRQHP